ncbi:MAG: hypothetical protein ACKVS9_00895 [Phycisphaerae bacterium]
MHERREWLDSLTLDEIFRDIQAMKNGASERGGVYSWQVSTDWVHCHPPVPSPRFAYQ